MEPESLPIENAFIGLIVLAVIPVVIFALWSDYFGRYIDQTSSQNPQFDRQPEVEKIRIGSFFVILFQCTLFLGSSDIQNAFPFLTQLTFIFAVSLQIFLQYRTEKKVVVDQEKSLALIKFGIKVGISWILGGALYVGILALCVKLASYFVQLVQVSPLIGTIILFLGGFLGAILGFTINFGLGPFYLKFILPVQSLSDPNFQQNIERCFTNANIPIPKLYSVDTHSLKLIDVFLSGYKNGKRFFKPALFISKQTLALLDPAELNAIISNQISHLALNHLKKRFAYTLGLILGTALISTLAISLGHYFFQDQLAIEIIASLVAIFSFLNSLKYLSKQAKQYELEADVYTIEALGVPLEIFSTALRKLDFSDPINTYPNIYSIDKGHPETELRIELMTVCIKTEFDSNKEPTSKSA